MGAQHARNAFNFVAKAELRAVQDLDRGRAEKLAAATGSPRIYASARDLIGSDEVDAVLVAAPDGFHAELDRKSVV